MTATSSERRLVVVGGVAAGMSAAARLRRMAPKVRITVFERTQYCSYNACGLPYYVAGVIADHHALVARTPAEFAEHGIEVRVQHEVTELDPASRTLRVRDLSGGSERSEGWDELLLATGAAPVVPVPGAGLPGSFTLRTVEDACAIRAWLERERPRRAVVIGGGYIGLEMAEALLARGVRTTVLDREPQLLPFVDADVAKEVEAELLSRGARVSLGTPVEAIEGNGRARSVLVGGSSLAADLVVLAIGVRPDSDLARAAGLALGPHGGVVVDQGMRTSTDGVWAAGDCCETRHLLNGGPAYVPLGTTANKQGRVAGANLGGRGERFQGVMGTAVVKVCDLHVGRTGLTVAEAERSGLDPVEASVTHVSRARYYPGHQPLRVKLIAERGSGRLLGAQLVGREGVATRLDVLAAALHGGAAAVEVAQWDLAYAPPFAPVWDPILLAARKVAEAA